MRGIGVWTLTGLSLTGLLLACAQADQAPAPPTGAGGLRTLVRLNTPRPADDRLRTDLAQAAGLVVSQLRQVDDSWWQVVFVCDTAERCQDGLNRLGAARSLVSEVAPEGRRQAPRQPVRAQERQ